MGQRKEERNGLGGSFRVEIPRTMYGRKTHFDARFQVQPRRTPAWRSTSAGRWRGKRESILRSRRSTWAKGRRKVSELARVLVEEKEDDCETHFLSGGATILTFIDEGAREVISFCIRSAGESNERRGRGRSGQLSPVRSFFRRRKRKTGKHSPIPEYMVVPPERTMFP